MVKLSFTAEYAGLLFLLNGLIILIFLYGRKKKRDRVMVFGNYETLKKVAGGDFLRSDDLILILRVLAVTLLIIGLSSPVLVKEVMGANQNFALVMDASASMFTSDISPNRFQAAKEVTKDFVSQLGNSSKVGLITYAGKVKEEQALTSNHEKVKDAISKANIGDKAGTATGNAVAAGISMLLGQDKPGTVILITDGINNVGQPLNESKRFAQVQNVSINTIGIGKTNISSKEFGMVKGENATKMDFPNLNKEELRKLSNRTGGEAVFVSSKEGLKSAFVELEKEKKQDDISKWFFIIAGGLLVLEVVFRSTDLEVIP